MINDDFFSNLANSTENYYLSKAAEKDEARRVGWRDEVAQSTRFKRLCYILAGDSEFSVSDVGCGRGDLLQYLRANITERLEYRGYDIMESMISQSRLVYANQSGSSFHKIKDFQDLQVSDYSLASGIFNLKGNNSDNQWNHYIKETLCVLSKNSRKGFAANFLTSYSDVDRRDSSLYYSDPCEIFRFVKEEITPRVVLLHDYREYDFTIGGFMNP